MFALNSRCQRFSLELHANIADCSIVNTTQFQKQINLPIKEVGKVPAVALQSCDEHSHKWNSLYFLCFSRFAIANESHRCKCFTPIAMSLCSTHLQNNRINLKRSAAQTWHVKLINNIYVLHRFSVDKQAYKGITDRPMTWSIERKQIEWINLCTLNCTLNAISNSRNRRRILFLVQVSWPNPNRSDQYRLSYRIY